MRKGYKTISKLLDAQGPAGSLNKKWKLYMYMPEKLFPQSEDITQYSITRGMVAVWGNRGENAQQDILQENMYQLALNEQSKSM